MTLYAPNPSLYKPETDVWINGNPEAVPYAGIPPQTPGVIVGFDCRVTSDSRFNFAKFHLDDRHDGRDTSTDYVVKVKFTDAAGKEVIETVKPSHVAAVPRLEY